MDKMYALLNEQSVIINVIMLDDESSQELIDSILTQNNAVNLKKIDDDKWGTHFYMGGLYEENILWPLKPYPSWIKNYEKKDWAAPVLYPDNEKGYRWNENILNWEEITE